MSAQLLNNSALHQRLASMGSRMKVINNDGWMMLRIEFANKIKGNTAMMEFVNISLKENGKSLHIVSHPHSRTFTQFNKYLFSETHGKDQELLEQIRQYLLLVNLQ